MKRCAQYNFVFLAKLMACGVASSSFVAEVNGCSLFAYMSRLVMAEVVRSDSDVLHDSGDVTSSWLKSRVLIVMHIPLIRLTMVACGGSNIN